FCQRLQISLVVGLGVRREPFREQSPQHAQLRLPEGADDLLAIIGDCFGRGRGVQRIVAGNHLKKDREILDARSHRSRMIHGLRVAGGSKLAYCVVTVLPRMMAPAWRNLLITVPSARAMLLAHNFEPAAVGQSKTSKMSLMPMGMPCKGPR